MEELPKVLVFLGAGASVPFGNPTMQEMVISFEKALAGRGITMPAEFLGTAAELYRSIKDTLLAANGYADLESVFSVIEMISKNVEYRELGYTPTFTLSRLASKSFEVQYSPSLPIIAMSTERRNPRKRDQALNDATGGQLGEEPRPDPYPEKDPRREFARKKSKQV